MERYYNGGYYLVKQTPLAYGPDKGRLVGSCSACINFSVFDDWCLSWMGAKPDETQKQALRLTQEKLEAIYEWTDSRFYNGSNVLPDLKTALEFKHLFFKSVNDIGIYSTYFSETDADHFLHEFAPGKNTNTLNTYNGDFGLRNNLAVRRDEVTDDGAELLGYDLIGVESSGAFHSFYCHDITTTLIGKFSLTINANGLFDKPAEPDKIREYLNAPGAPVEPVPWFIVKVKRQKMEGADIQLPVFEDGFGPTNQ